MHTYPLRFKAESTPADVDLTIVDAEKNVILFRPKITEPIEKGETPCVIFADKTSNQPLYTTLFQKNNDVESYLIKSLGGGVLGTLVAETEHIWKVLDEKGNLLANIEEKSTWKNSCLFQLLTLPFDQSLQDEILKFLAPHRYIMTLNGKKVLDLHEVVTTFNEDYKLKKKGEFSEREETLLLISLITALGLKEK